MVHIGSDVFIHFKDWCIIPHMLLDTTAKLKQLDAKIAALEAQRKLLREFEQEEAAHSKQASMLNEKSISLDPDSAGPANRSSKVRGMSKAVLDAIPMDGEISSPALFDAVRAQFPETSQQAVVVAARRWEDRKYVKAEGTRGSGLRFRKLRHKP